MTIRELSKRSNDIFKQLVESYVETGIPVGSRTLSRRLQQNLSPATIRNIMADLEEAGLLYAPHTSAGRLPTEHGLRYFINGLLEVGDITLQEKEKIDSLVKGSNYNLDELLDQANRALSGLSQCAGVVVSPKLESTLSHVEFVYLSKGRALVVLVSQEGMIENRIILIPESITPSILTQASQYLSSCIYGKTLSEVIEFIQKEKILVQSNLNSLTNKVIEAGLAVWSEPESKGSLIVHGQAHLLDSVQEMQDLENIRELFATLDAKESVYGLLNETVQAEGIQIFIGAENPLFAKSGCSMVTASYTSSSKKIIGSIGVVGPVRMNYGRIIPLVDYTAKLISKLLG